MQDMDQPQNPVPTGNDGGDMGGENMPEGGEGEAGHEGHEEGAADENV